MSTFRQGSIDRGDAHVGTCYGHKDAKSYNRSVTLATEKEEGRKVDLFYFARKLLNDDYIAEFVVVNGPVDPGMRVYTRIPGTTAPITITGDPSQNNVKPLKALPPDLWALAHSETGLPPGLDWLEGEAVVEEWQRIEQDGQYVFYPPASYKGGAITWLHSKHLLSESLVYESQRSFLIPKGRTVDVEMSEVGQS